MKGDFTRFTFRPEKRYTNVLMQQGRMQLDADWNEQMSILGYLNQTQARDMIGGSGTSRTVGGFQVSATPDGSDLVISAGNYYINGILCELPEGSEVIAEYDIPPPAPFPSPEAARTSTPATRRLKVRVPVFTVDGLAYAANQWVDVPAFTDLKNPRDRWFRIENPNPREQTLDLVYPASDPAALDAQLQKLTANKQGAIPLPLRRLTTYLTQPDYPGPLTADLKNGFQPDRRYLVYLDTWQRHITTLDDPDLQEVALGAIDTTTRLKTVWQVKLLEVGDSTTSVAPDQPFPQFNQITQNRQVFMTARLRPTPEAANGVANQLVNALYRVEIHQGGSLEEARFKWSRDNGTVVSAVDRILPDSNVIQVQATESDSERSFKPGQWVELINEDRELRGEAGILLRLTDVRPGGKLIYNASSVGEAIALDEFAPAKHPKLRAWDWTSDSQGLPLKSSDPDGWIELERNIQVKFETSPNMRYATGDYWLIPSRANGAIEWIKNVEGNPQRQLPLGIQHGYSRLALTVLTGTAASPQFSDPGNEGDCRRIFPSLINCLDGRESIFTGTVGIGVSKPAARLHIRGATVLEGRGTLSGEAGSKTLTGVETRFAQQLSPGDRLTTVDGTGKSVELVVEAIATDTLLNLTTTLANPIIAASFTHRPAQPHPIVRIDTEDPQTTQPQFVVNNLGNVGMGVAAPGAKLEVCRAEATPAASVLHVKAGSGVGTSLLQVQTDGKVGIGFDTPQANLDVKGVLRVATGVGTGRGFLQIQPQDGNPVQFTSNAGHRFDRSLTVVTGTATNTGFLRIQPQDSGAVHFTANAGYHFTSGTAANTGFLRIRPQDSDAVNFTANAGYNFTSGTVANSGFFRIQPQDSGGVNLTANAGYTFRSGTTDNTGFFRIQPQDSAAVTLTANAGYRLTSGTATNTGFFQIQPQDNSVVNFTSNAGYSFDKDVRISGKLSVMNGAVETIALNPDGIAIAKGNVILTEGNVEIKRGVLKIGNFQIDQDAADTHFNQITIRDGITFGRPTAAFRISTNPPHFNQAITFARRVTIQSEGLTVANGGVTVNSGGLTVSNNGLTVGNGGASITGSSQISLRRVAGVAEKLTLLTDSTTANPTPFIIDLPGRRLSIREGDTRLMTIAPPQDASKSNSRVNVLGELVVGANFFNRNDSLINGLLVEGHTGIGVFNTSADTSQPLLAKLEVRGVTNNATDSALNITNQNRKSLLYVRNDGQVAIGSLADQAPLNVTLPTGVSAAATKLVVSGDGLVTGKLFAQKVAGTEIEQVSSRTQKQNIVALSSQAATDLLRSLNPVTFNYTTTKDTALHAGFIAEDSPTLVTSTDGQAIRILDVVAVLTRTVKDQREAIILLNRIVKQQQAAIATLFEHINAR